MVRKQHAINNSPPQAGIASSKQQLADVPVAVMTPHAEDRAAVAVGASHAKERITQIDKPTKANALQRKENTPNSCSSAWASGTLLLLHCRQSKCERLPSGCP
jgi:hypothetical protein